MSVILAPGRLRQGDCHGFKDSLGYRVKSVSNQPTNQDPRLLAPLKENCGGLGRALKWGSEAAFNPSSSKVCLPLLRYFFLIFEL